MRPFFCFGTGIAVYKGIDKYLFTKEVRQSRQMLEVIDG